MKKLGTALLVLALGASMAFAGGGADPSTGKAADAKSAPAAKTTTIRWAYWGGDARVKISQEAINIFQSKYPDLVVNPEVSGGAGDHFTKVNTQLSGGNGPDIIQMGGNLPEYVAKGVLLPLNTYMGNVLDAKSVDTAALEEATVDGKLYGVSTGGNMPALVYNKALLQRVGMPLPNVVMTFDEFRAYCMQLKDKLPKGVYPMQDIGCLPSNSSFFSYWSATNGTKFYTAEGKTYQTPADIAKYFDLFADYRANGIVPPADIAAGYAESNADTSMLIAGKCVFNFLWTNQLKGYQAASKDELDFIELPGAAVKNNMFQQQSQFYTVNKDSKNPALAVKLINFLVNSPDAAKVLGNDRGTSVSASARSAILTDPVDQKILAYMKIAGKHASKRDPNIPNDTEFISTFYLIYQKVAFKQLSTTDGGKQGYDLIVKMINKK